MTAANDGRTADGSRLTDGRLDEAVPAEGAKAEDAGSRLWPARREPSDERSGDQQAEPESAGLSDAEIGALIQAVIGDTSPDGLRLIAILRLMHATRLSIQALVCLPHGGLASDEMAVRVRRRRHQAALLPIDQAARSALDAYLEYRHLFLPSERPSRWLFPAQGAFGHLTAMRCSQMLKAAAVKAGIDPDSPGLQASS
ncbi:MAG TPA: hypothetical protein VM689_18060 [Aliidongia sp.]|nr:hypothetical protein [Aliidongia sp.]